jgi:hypothetical protein
MRRLARLSSGLIALCLASAGAGAPERSAGGEVTLRPVKYAELGKIVRGYRGKVVLVDYWADY